MRRAVLPLALSLLLWSCTSQKVQNDAPTASLLDSASSSSITSDTTASVPPLSELEFGDSEVSAVASSSEVSSAISMAEHVLPSGVLELGDADAPHTLTIFTHHSCPYCQDVQSTLLPEVIQPFITSGKLRVQIVLLQMSKYPESALQAKALYCSATQQKGLLMHMMLTQKGIKDEAALMKEVKTLAFDEAAFKACLESPQSDSAVNMQEQMARSVGVTLVPSFLLDKTLSTGYPEEDALRADLENATE